VKRVRNVPLVTSIVATAVALVLVVVHTRVTALPGFAFAK